MSIDLQVADCMDYLRQLEDNSVDLVIVDPPYSHIISEAWDNQWDTPEKYLQWCRGWTEECFRVLKPNSCFYVWGTTKTDTLLRYKLFVLNKIPDAAKRS